MFWFFFPISDTSHSDSGPTLSLTPITLKGSDVTFRLGSRAVLLHPGSLHELLYLLSESYDTPGVALYALQGVYTNIPALESVCIYKSSSGTLTVCCVPFSRLTGLFRFFIHKCNHTADI